MSESAKRLLSDLLVLYGAKLPYHPGKWRVVDFLIALFGLEHTPSRGVRTRRAGLWFVLDTSNYLDRCVYYLGSYESRDTSFVKAFVQPGMVVIDVGANIGWYSLASASRLIGTGLVFAFEPSEEEFNRLKANVALNGFRNVQLQQEAVSDTSGEAWLTEARDAGTTRLATDDTEAHRRTAVTTLDIFMDQVAPGRLDFIKVDIEGAEVHFLDGAHRTLARWRPVMMIEVCDENLGAFGASAVALRGRLVDLGYQLYRTTRTGLSALGAERESAYFYNAICVPRERALAAFIPWGEVRRLGTQVAGT